MNREEKQFDFDFDDTPTQGNTPVQRKKYQCAACGSIISVENRPDRQYHRHDTCPFCKDGWLDIWKQYEFVGEWEKRLQKPYPDNMIVYYQVKTDRWKCCTYGWYKEHKPTASALISNANGIPDDLVITEQEELKMMERTNEEAEEAFDPII